MPPLGNNTKPYAMKVIFFLLIGFYLGVNQISIAQQNTFWFKSENPQLFLSDQWKDISLQYNLSQPVQALTASRNESLRKVYEIKANSDINELATVFKVFGNQIHSLVRGPEYNPLFVPSDMNFQAGISDYALSIINAPQAWDLTHGDDSIIIAISDQNYDVAHPDLEGKYTYYDATNNTVTTHGTAVAITAAGKTNNNYGLASIGFNSGLALYRMNFNEILAASYAGADVINISWSSGCFYSQIEQDVINEVVQNGSFIVAAAGNGNTCGLPDAHVYPASYEHVFSVTSIGPSDNHEQWIGDPTSTHNHNDSVDLAAPGYDVAVSPAVNWYLNTSGTSFATAYVSGTVALMLAVNKCMSNLDIETILKSTSAPIDNLNPAYAGKLGAGRLDAYQAVLAALSTFNPIVPTFTLSDGCAANDAAAQLVVQGGQFPYVAAWSNNYVGFNDTALNTNTYFVQLIDAHGCRLDTSVYVFDVVPPVYQWNIVNPSCSDSQDGSIELMVSNATQTSINWSSGANSFQLFNLIGGNYLATLSYGPNCSINETVALTAPSPIQVLGNVSHELTASSGAVDITVSGGTAPYSFNWSNNQQSEDLTALTAGIYDVTIVDANGCQANTQFEIEDQLSNAGGGSPEAILEPILYPNPNQGQFTIKIPEEGWYLVSVFDLQGRVVYERDFSKSEWVNLPLPQANYLVKFIDLNLNKVFVKELIIY